MSWLQIEDFCRTIDWLIAQKELREACNLVAPNATDNKGCMAVFRRIAGRRFGLPATRWMLEIGTFLMRTETELVLKSRWVVPGYLEKDGFQFRWTDFEAALDDLMVRPRIEALAGLPSDVRHA